MKSTLASFCFMLIVLIGKTQTNCEVDFVPDTLFVPKEAKTFSGKYLQTSLKNNATLQLYSLNNNKFYLKLVVKENLYFDKTDLLEILSGTKSWARKDITQYQLDKSTGYYVVEIFKNYIGTLKDEGITGIVFGKVKTTFSKQDANEIKKISKCLYETIDTKKITN
jgi:hypothetical protein